MLEGKITLARFASWCNVFDDNVVVLDRKLVYKRKHTLAITHRATF